MAAETPPDHPELGQVVGASVLCFGVDPKLSKMYFLLGKERRNTKWAGGSQLWSDFGGSTSGRDSPEETAAREFLEETMCNVRYFRHDNLPRRSSSDIAESLRNNQYVFRIVHCCGTEEAPKSYVTYVVQIPWDAYVPYRFQKIRRGVLNGSNTSHPAVDNGEILRDYTEKTALEWWSVPQLQHASDHDGVLGHRSGTVERCKGTFLRVIPSLLAQLSFLDPDVVEE